MNELIVGDAGPLIALARIDAIAVLAKVHSRVIVPRIVCAECVADLAKPSAKRIDAAFGHRLLTLQPDSPSLSGLRIATLDEGESAAIELAKALNAMLLMDERCVRAIATRRGLGVVGTLGILITARKRNIVPALAPMLHGLTNNGYFIADALIAATLASVGEVKTPPA